FEMSKSIRVADQIRKMNRSLMDQGRPYVLIGPGRWGSTDQWLGIPVAWSDIAGARIIVETPVEERIIDPSQGSHFFHNMISANIGYMTIGKGEANEVGWDWLGGQPAEGESENVKHVRLQEPMEARLDGKRGIGVILKKCRPGREEVTSEVEG
ncbi:MAG: histidine kinase, partial [Thermoplasmata archaeon]|nr:histidine kinase [Thermoplasmata archaeon]